jgi:hypothetical protein
MRSLLLLSALIAKLKICLMQNFVTVAGGNFHNNLAGAG